MSNEIANDFKKLGEREHQRQVKEQKWRDVCEAFKRFYGTRWIGKMVEHLAEEMDNEDDDKRNSSSD